MANEGERGKREALHRNWLTVEEIRRRCENEGRRNEAEKMEEMLGRIEQELHELEPREAVTGGR